MNSSQEAAHNEQRSKRYPGVKPFETSERALFFGRDRDIEDLLDLIWLEKLVVLFGKSGYGKSSLINAGILPELAQEAVPIVVRLGSYVEGQTASPLDNLRLKIEEVLTNNPDADFIQKLDVPKTLWHQMKQKQSRRQRRFVLIFDQFEEFFTYPIADQQAFKEQMADLLYTEVPQAVRNINDTLTDSQQTFIATPFDAKVLFAIRADRMSLLDSMKDKLPAILQKRYELKGLTEEQAREAIQKRVKELAHEHKDHFKNIQSSTKNENIAYILQRIKRDIKCSVHPNFEKWLDEEDDKNVLSYLTLMMSLKIYDRDRAYIRYRLLFDKRYWNVWRENK